MSDSINGISYKTLIDNAKEAQAKAYCPYSNYAVGAAVLTKEGHIYKASNVENASFGLTICAERLAIFKAISEGSKQIIAIAIIANEETHAKPCGACIQVMVEFMSDNALVILANQEGHYVVRTLKDLIPEVFRLKTTLSD